MRAVSTALGLGPEVSVARDVLGFTRGRVPARIIATRPVPAVSLRGHLASLTGRRFRVCLILAGSELISAADESVIDYAIYRLREIYAGAGVGVDIIRRDSRTSADSSGHANVLTAAEIDSTSHDLTVDGTEVPVVIPDNMNVSETRVNPDGTKSVWVTLGKSPIGGRCGRRDAEGMRSAVVGINGEETARTLAHEIGHFLGLSHPDTPGTDLMTQTGSVPGDPFTATSLTDAQRSVVRRHCTIDDAPLPI